MATFKVGQRVRIVSDDSGHNGCEGTVMGARAFISTYGVTSGRRFPPHWTYPVAIDAAPSPDATGWWWKNETTLRPLTDPGADEFIENMERFARVVPRVPVTG